MAIALLSKVEYVAEGLIRVEGRDLQEAWNASHPTEYDAEINMEIIMFFTENAEDLRGPCFPFYFAHFLFHMGEPNMVH